MRGFGIIIGYLLGNKQARDWCIKTFCEASCAFDKEFKKTPLGKAIYGDKCNAQDKKNDTSVS